jgi:hypothetical protein
LTIEDRFDRGRKFTMARHTYTLAGAGAEEMLPISSKAQLYAAGILLG